MRSPVIHETLQKRVTSTERESCTDLKWLEKKKQPRTELTMDHCTVTVWHTMKWADEAERWGRDNEHSVVDLHIPKDPLRSGIWCRRPKKDLHFFLINYEFIDFCFVNVTNGLLCNGNTYFLSIFIAFLEKGCRFYEGNNLLHNRGSCSRAVWLVRDYWTRAVLIRNSPSAPPGLPSEGFYVHIWFPHVRLFSFESSDPLKENTVGCRFHLTCIYGPVHLRTMM